MQLLMQTQFWIARQKWCLIQWQQVLFTSGLLEKRALSSKRTKKTACGIGNWLCKGNHDKFRLAIHTLKCACVTYLSLQVTNMTVNIWWLLIYCQEKKKKAVLLGITSGIVCLVTVTFTFHLLHRSINLSPSLIPSLSACISRRMCSCCCTHFFVWKESALLFVCYLWRASPQRCHPLPPTAPSILILRLPTTWCPTFSLARAVPKPCDSCVLTPSCTSSESPAVRRNLHFNFYHLFQIYQRIWTSTCIHSLSPPS